VYLEIISKDAYSINRTQNVYFCIKPLTHWERKDFYFYIAQFFVMNAELIMDIMKHVEYEMICRISGFHSCGYEEYHLLGYDAV
jgi:hypothetical protein